MSAPDVHFAHGAVHDDLGPITSFASYTERGRKWMLDWCGEDHAIIETEHAELVITCAERDGLVLRAA
jgi:hypothetical protein